MENRNEACEMEVAVVGSRAKLRAKEGGKVIQLSLLEWSAAEWKRGQTDLLPYNARVGTTA